MHCVKSAGISGQTATSPDRETQAPMVPTRVGATPIKLDNVGPDNVRVENDPVVSPAGWLRRALASLTPRPWGEIGRMEKEKNLIVNMSIT